MGRKNQPVGPSGLLVVDKPEGPTSHDVVARMRRLAGTRRVGHAGTLDPMATGVLIVGLNQATKLLTWVSGEQKAYDATIRLGSSTVTDDAEGEVLATAPAAAVAAVDRAAIEAGIERLTGTIAQVPSSVSAIKVGGERSYDRARAGRQVELEAREITVDSFAIRSVRAVQPDAESRAIDVEVSVVCSPGTYIRALARDLGEDLGVGGHLTALRRTRIGEVGLEDAHTLEELAARREAGEPLPLLDVGDAAARLFSRRELSNEEATAVSNGRWIEPQGLPLAPKDEPVVKGKEGVVPAHRLAAGFAPDGTLVALLQEERRRGKVWATPHLVLVSGTTFGPKPTDGDSPKEERA